MPSDSPEDRYLLDTQFVIGVVGSSTYAVHFGATPFTELYAAPVQEVGAYAGRQLLNCNPAASGQVAQFLAALAAEAPETVAEAVGYIQGFFRYELNEQASSYAALKERPSYPRQFEATLDIAAGSLGIHLSADGFGRLGRGIEQASLESIGALMHQGLLHSIEMLTLLDRVQAVLREQGLAHIDDIPERGEGHAELEAVLVASILNAAGGVAVSYANGDLTRSTEPVAVAEAISDAEDLVEIAGRLRAELNEQ